ncbi:hypothetical protein DPMN_116555 [Dreissena polymorpha]|uniref:Uncharacterized protein n=1 Tax=Dreissena polymorpha TaxID=45954 RepID=A0A9D4KP12_DREPO|nr:hypothetical protein DPMN_116555 [Dreissena polymorpha]
MWTGRRRTKTNPKTSPEQSEINKTNVLTKFRDDYAKNVTSISHKENCHPPGSHFQDDWAKNVTSRVHVIQLTGIVFKPNSHIKETNVLTKFHENWAKNVTSRVFTCFHYMPIDKNAPPTGGHVFSPIWTIFELVRESIKPMKTAPPTGGHVIQRTGATFKLNSHIIKTNILTNFELDRDFIGTKLLTKFHEDRTINVASRVFTNKCGRTDGRRTKIGYKSLPEQSGWLKTLCILNHIPL